MYVVVTRFVYGAFEQRGSAPFATSLLKFVLFEMYNYLNYFQQLLLGAPLQLGALSVRLVVSSLMGKYGTENITDFNFPQNLSCLF